MKKIFTLIFALATTTAIMAQKGAMTFVGESSFSVSTAAVETIADTVKFAMNGTTSGDITIPSKSYSMQGRNMTIPSFTIHNAAFTMDMTTMTATFADQTFSETITVDGAEKTITGTSLSGSYKRTTNTLNLVVKFQYGAMPLESTYTVTGYYVKPYTDALSVCIGGQADYTYQNESVTYNVRTYKKDDVTKMDVQIPTYVLSNTVMGDLTIGGYTVTGLTYDETKGGYYKDYANDGLTMHFTAVRNGITTMDKDYTLATADGENILITTDNTGKVASIVNNFQPGSMPYAIVSTFPGTTTGIKTISKAADQGMTYNLAGQRVSNSSKGIVIRNGRKYINK